MNLTSESVKRTYISSEVRFYTMVEIQDLTGWSDKTVKKLFNDPKFPSANFGRTKVVEAHALIDFFSKKHVKEREIYWRN